MEMSGRSGGQGWRMMVWGGAAALMLAAAAATRLTDEMAWDPADFILVAIMLAAACGAWEIAMRRTKNWAYSAGAVVAAGAVFLLFLVNGAIGLVGNENDPVNLLFFGVLTLALGGAIIVRFGSEGMARAMAVTAGAQVVAGARRGDGPRLSRLRAGDGDVRAALAALVLAVRAGGAGGVRKRPPLYAL